MDGFRTQSRLLWALLACQICGWAVYLVVMLRYPLSEPYPIGRLHGQLADFAVVFALMYAALAAVVVWTRDAPFWSATKPLMRGVLVAVGALVLMALVIPPTRSPDLYWTLLVGKGWVEHGVNPYVATSEAIGPHLWSAKATFVVSMVYGPLWTYLVGAAAAATDSLRVAMTLMKAVGLASLAAGALALWKLMNHTGMPSGRRNQMMVLLLSNPLLLQAGLVDVSSDILTFAAISWAILLTVRGRAMPAVSVLLMGGLVKYIPWLLLPIPLAQWFVSQTRPSRKDIALLCAAMVVVVLAYLPFGTAALMGSGMREAFATYHMKYMAFPGAWAFNSLGISVVHIQIAGLLIAIAALGYCLYRRRWAAAWVVAPAVLMTFGTPWVNPWYFLWILPGAVGLGSVALIVLTGVAGILMPWAVHPALMGFFMLGVVAAGIAWHARGRIMGLWKKYRGNSNGPSEIC